jgi:glycosyltransferase involved in cell wall biosynthesis
MPLISVVIPIYNTEPYLEACLLSIIDQRFSDFEVICVDDLSKDRSREIVQDLMRGDPRIRLFNMQEKRGIGGVRNAGLAEARANYVAFFDSDDYLDIDMLQLLHDGTEQETFDVVICGHRTVDGEGRVLEQHAPQKRRITKARELKDRLLLANPSPWNKLWRTSLFSENGITFPTRMHHDDLATIPRLILKARSINFIDRICYNYVNRAGSESSVGSDGHVMDFFRAFDLLKDFLVAEGIYPEEKHNLEKLVRINFGWYADRLLAKRNISAEGVKQYAKFCALMAGGYISFDDRFREMDTVELIEQISTIGVRPELHSSSGAFARFRSFLSRLGHARDPAPLVSVRGRE